MPTLHLLSSGLLTSLLLAGCAPPKEDPADPGPSDTGEPGADTADPDDTAGETGDSSPDTAVDTGDPDTSGGDPPLTFSVVARNVDVDVALVLDSTCSMLPTVSALSSEFSGIAADLQASLGDVGFGLASFKDYNYADLGGEGALPFVLEQQVTSDAARTDDALADLVGAVGGGGDWAESSFEALYQAAAGSGYDQGCDGAYDPEVDVLPLLSSGDDVFGGGEGETYTAGLPGSGTRGGMGFRDGSLPVFVLVTDGEMRDPLDSYPVPPQACSWQYGAAASSLSAINAVKELDGVTIGVAVDSGGVYPAEEPMQDSGFWVLTWDGASAADLHADIAGAVQTWVGDLAYDRVWLEVSSDLDKSVTTATPAEYTDVPFGETVDFAVELSGPVLPEPTEETAVVLLEAYGEYNGRTSVLGSQIYYVLVP